MEKNAETDGNKVVAMQPVKVFSAKSKVEADMLEELLEGENIQVYRRPLESGGYMNVYMGFSAFGEDIFVDEADAERALELVAVFQNAAEEPEEEPAENKTLHKHERNRYIMKIMILVSVAVFAGYMAFLLITALFTFAVTVGR